MEDPNVFAGAFVERTGERRKDPDWLAEALADGNSRFLPVWGDRCLAGGDPPGVVLLERATIADHVDDDNVIFLGLFRNHPAFAVAIDGGIEAPFQDIGEFRDLRYLGTVLPVFPRTDPAIIVLVADGDRCLLGRQASWPDGRYSTIAGFVEPGESVEDAVRREVFEETNIRVGAVRYHSSQPWPFPSSLMLGFVAEADSEEIDLNDGELEDARWFTRDELKSGDVGLPFRISIARRLVDHFINGS